MRGWIGKIQPRHSRTGANTLATSNVIPLRPFCTMVDWLSVMMMGPWFTFTARPGDCFRWDVPNVRPGLMVYCSDKETGAFLRIFYVTDGAGNRLITIQCNPRDPKKFPPDFCIAQFDNSTLPTGEWRELLAALRHMGCEHMGVQRVDIAADGWEDERLGGGGDFIPVVQAALRGHGDYFGKAHWKTHHLGHNFNGFEFGSKAGNKFMRCYRKKREMKAKGLKPHVVAAWSAALNGIDPMADPREVGRLEVQMKGKELRRYFRGESDAELLANLHDPRTRVQVFASTTDTIWDFRQWPTDGRARSAKPMHVWDWSLCTTNAPDLLPREQKARRLSPQRVKAGLHFLYDLYYHTGEAGVLLAAERAARSAGPQFVDYMRQKETQWQRLWDSLDIGTAKRGGTDDAFTLSFMRNLLASRMDDHAIGPEDAATQFMRTINPEHFTEFEEVIEPPTREASVPPPPPDRELFDDEEIEGAW